MRDIPVFTTPHGVASLVLREIPYKGIAYITLQDTLQPKELVDECVDFCKAVGAERIYAKGHSILEAYPLHTAVWQMVRSRDGLPETDAALFPVTEETLERWRDIYNDKMRDIPNASTMSKEDSRKILEKGSGYFVHRMGELLGIGIAGGETVESVIAVEPGAGTDVMLALCGSLFAERVVLEVASVNHRAVRLYERLGFVKTAELSVWYDVEIKNMR